MVFRLLPRMIQLLRNQWVPPERLLDIQTVKLRKLLTHAYENVPYYRQVFETAGITPGDIKDPFDLSKLPITTKAQVVTYPPGDLVARGVDHGKCLSLRTSGSQGMPFEILVRPEEKAWWGLLAIRTNFANHYHFGQKILIFSDARRIPHNKRMVEYLGLFRKTYTSIYDDLEQQVETAIALQPHVLRGMPSDLSRFAQAVRKKGITSINPKLIITSAELLDSKTRNFITETFPARLVDCYGSIECGWIAWECPARAGYHLNADCLIVEFIRDGKAVNPGEPGEIVVTNLHSYAMPFIRYSVGDVGIPNNTPCPCGRGLPLMNTVEGRMVDCLTLSNGRTVSPYQLTCLVEQIPGIQRYQIIQTQKDGILVKIIPDGRFTEQTSQRIIDDLNALLGEKILIHTELVQEIPKDSSGKFRVVKSHLSL